MKFKLYSSILSVIGISSIFLLTCCCASQNKLNYKTKEPPNYSVTKGDIEPSAEDEIPKGAIKLRGLILTDGKKLKDRYIYDFKFIETVSFGSTYTSIVPKAHEVVELITFEANLKKGSEVEVFVLALKSKPKGKMRLDMITK